MRKNGYESAVRVIGAAALTGWLLCAAAPASSQDGAPRLQGQVPLADQMSGRALAGYSQHVKLVGHNNILNRLQNGNLGWLDDCAYVAAYYGASDPTAGLAILDVSKPKNPRLTGILPGIPGTRESQVEANADSRVVIVMTFPTTTYFGDPPAPNSLLKIYEPVGDCTNLVLRGTYDYGKEAGQTIVTHEHLIWRDKVYATVTSPTAPGPSLSVVDISDKASPALITTWDLSDEAGMPASAIHDLHVSPDGTRAYVNLWTPRLGVGNGGAEVGLAILDTSEVAAWKSGMPRPTIRRISRIIYWGPPMPGNSHSTQLVKIKGRKYVLTENEGASGAPDNQCPGGWAQIIDVNDELNPTVISSFRLEVSKPENCPITLPDHNGIPTSGPVSILQNGIRYSTHYLGVDDPESAKIAAFTWYSSGLWLVDISDPYKPKEVGYFIPPAINIGGPRSYPDRAYSYVRFHQGNIWFVSINGGFWVVKLTGQNKSADAGETDSE